MIETYIRDNKKKPKEIAALTEKSVMTIQREIKRGKAAQTDSELRVSQRKGRRENWTHAPNRRDTLRAKSSKKAAPRTDLHLH
jgi:IS30 family transposase